MSDELEELEDPEEYNVIREIERHREELRQIPVAPTRIQPQGLSERRPEPVEGKVEPPFVIEETPRELLERAEAERKRLFAALRQKKHPKFGRLHLKKGMYYQEFQVPICKPGEVVSPEERVERCIAYFERYTPAELLIFSLEAIIQDDMPQMVKVELREEAPAIVRPPGTRRLKELSTPPWPKNGR